ncbi:MAG: Tll0287-like domain-containing protein, partial [Oceanobacter sp.]
QQITHKLFNNRVGQTLATAALLASILSAAQTSAQNQINNPDQAALAKEAMQHIKAFGGELKTAVKAGVMQGGPQNAILVCNQQAPAIADKHSADKWSVGRTSMKLRNPDNAPTEWEAQVLRDFEAKLTAGADPKTLTARKIEDGQFHFMKAITVGSLCLNCHGDKLEEPVALRLSELYPNDQATGYQLGQLRGAFTLTRPLD